MREARVDIAGETVGAIDGGLLVLVCAEPADTDAHADRLVAKLLKLRIFGDDAGKMNRSVQDVPGGGLLIVSQFTLAADRAAAIAPLHPRRAAELGRRLYETVLRLAAERHPRVASGRFGADMQVSLVADGPVTIPMRVRA